MGDWVQIKGWIKIPKNKTISLKKALASVYKDDELFVTESHSGELDPKFHCKNIEASIGICGNTFFEGYKKLELALKECKYSFDLEINLYG